MAASALRARALFVAQCARRGARAPARGACCALARPVASALPAARCRAPPLPGARRGVAASAGAGNTVAGPCVDPARDVAVAFSADAPLSHASDVLALGVFEDALESAELAAADAALGGALRELIAESEFKAKAGSVCHARVAAQGGPRRVALIGLGARGSDGSDGAPAAAWKAFGAAAAGVAKNAKAATLSLSLLGPAPGAALSDGALRSLVSGALLGVFEDGRFKSKPKAATLKAVTIHAPLAAEAATAAAAKHAAALVAGVQLTKQLVAAPPNVATPTALAEAAAAIAADFPGRFKLTVLEREQCAARGMGAFLGVAEASDEPPKLIHLQYLPPGGATPGAPVLGLVGKGLTFDSGGYNIKAGAGSMIEMMKFDMGGAGAVLGAARALGGLAPAGVTCHFVIASCENMIGSRGLRPGDVLTASNGKTIEVNNTDAEGRLTLADALIYAQRVGGVTRVVDIATLTGACMIALGNNIGGMWTPHDSLAASLTDASVAAGEKLWRMPLEDSYWEQMSSPIADMKNTGMGKGGAITAALFLREFVEKGTEWAHLDIAGPVWDDKQGGATGFAAATLANWVCSHAEKK